MQNTKLPGRYLTPTQDLTLCDSYNFPTDQKRYIEVISFAAVTIPKSEWTEAIKLHFSLTEKKKKNQPMAQVSFLGQPFSMGWPQIPGCWNATIFCNPLG